MPESRSTLASHNIQNHNYSRLLIVIAVMSATLMQVLDTTIVNVALPHMQGSLNASSDQISWTLTTYLVASAIFMPLTGYFSDRLGQKNYLLLSIIGFTLTSILCGAAQNLTEIVAFRFLQGIFGAALVPLSQAIIADAYPKEEMGKAMAIWGAGVMVGPILGPTIGGYLTDISSWRWTFYVNVPVGILSLLLAWRFVPEGIKKERKLDWLGCILLSLAIGALQYFLDRGNQEDWLNSSAIVFAVLLACFSFVGFLFHTLHKRHGAVFDVRIFKNRNFTVVCIITILLGVCLYGSMVVQPILLQSFLGYPVLTAGLVMAPRGVSSMISMAIVSKIMHRVDPRWIVIIGIFISAFGMAVGTCYSENIDLWWIIWPMLLQGFGMGMIFVPLSVLAFATLPHNARIEAAGLYALVRTVGSSIGIAITLTFMTRHAQLVWNQLGGFINIYNPALNQYLASLHVNINTPLAANVLAGLLSKQSQLLVFVNVFAFLAWSFVLMLPLVGLLKYKKAAIPIHE